MKRNVLYLIIFAIVAFVILFILIFFNQKRAPVLNSIQSATPIPTFYSFPTIDPSLLQTDEITISDISVKNFYRFMKNRNSDGDVLIEDNNSHSFVYYPQFRLFLLTVLTSPFEKGRIDAQQVFVDLLGITKDEACRLNVEVATSYKVNPTESKRSYQLSFCENK